MVLLASRVLDRVTKKSFATRCADLRELLVRTPRSAIKGLVDKTDFAECDVLSSIFGDRDATTRGKAAELFLRLQYRGFTLSEFETAENDSILNWKSRRALALTVAISG